MAAQANPISSIACDPQGQVMACASGSRSLPGGIEDPDITIWSLTGDRQRVRRRIIPRQGDVGLCTHLAWLPDTSALVSSWTSDRIVVVPLKGDGAPRTLEAEANSQLSARSASPLMALRLWAAAGDTLLRWSTVDWSKRPAWKNVMGSMKTGKVKLRALAVGRKSLIVGGRDGVVRLFDATNTPKFRRQWDVSTEPITQVALSPDERLIAAGSLDGTLALLDLQTLQVPLKQNAHSGEESNPSPSQGTGDCWPQRPRTRRFSSGASRTVSRRRFSRSGPRPDRSWRSTSPPMETAFTPSFVARPPSASGTWTF